jgi:feruloyl esterase
MAAFLELRLSLSALLLAISIPPVAVAATTCENLLSLKLKHGTVTVAQPVPAGLFKLPGISNTIRTTTAFCRVALTLKPSADSDIKVEVWMPSSGWNAKFQGVGNGGFAGAIDYQALSDAVSKGYAAAATDTGHEAGATDAQWALNHPEKIADFGYRAIHETADHAKAVIRAFYGGAPKRSYFNSCSNGGREALMEAQRFPADYDGIVAGSPANYWTHLLTQLIYNMQAIGTPESYIPSAKLRSIENNALNQCDALDGVKDGVIENPTACHLDLQPLLCRGAETNECLTQPQFVALAKIYAGPKTSSGQQVIPGLSPGGEAEPTGWSAWIDGAKPESSLQFAFGTNFFRYMVYNDPTWDNRISTVDHNMSLADEKLARTLNATDPDLKHFRARGGRLILYHGWADAAIPPQNTVSYYESIVRTMGPKESASFVRLFMVPGMEHCSSGGAGVSMYVLNPVPHADADRDVAAAVERWVEQGIAPERIIAGKPKSLGNTTEFSRTRPLCAWPKTSHYKGSGSMDEAANFTCQ